MFSRYTESLIFFAGFSRVGYKQDSRASKAVVLLPKRGGSLGFVSFVQLSCRNMRSEKGKIDYEMGISLEITLDIIPSKNI